MKCLLKLTAAAAVSLATGAAVFALNGYVMTPPIASGIFVCTAAAFGVVKVACARR